MFTKRHYIEIGLLIAKSKDKQQIIDELCKFFKADNERFNEQKFRDFITWNERQ